MVEKMFIPINSFCLYFHLYDLSPFFSKEELYSIRRSNRNDMSKNELNDFYDLVNKVPSQFQILEKNGLKGPEELLERLSKQNFLIGNLEFDKDWQNEKIINQMKKILVPDFLPFCSEQGQFPGRVGLGMNRLTPFDEIQMIYYLRKQGPLLVLINGDNIQKHKKDTVLYDIKSTDNYL